MQEHFEAPTKEFLKAIQARGKPHIRISNKPGYWICHDHEIVAWDDTPTLAFKRWKGFRDSEDETRAAIARSVCVPGTKSLN